MKTQYEIKLKRAYNQVKKWRTAFYLYEDKVGAKDRFISLIREELTESAAATTRKKALDLYVDVIFYCLSSAIEEGLSFKDIYREHTRSADDVDRSKCSWSSLARELDIVVYLSTAPPNCSLSSIIKQTLIVTRIIYGDRITDTEFFQAFDLVYKNNMKKFWTKEEFFSQCEYKTCIYAIRKGPRNVIVKDSRGKIMKPPGFVEVKL